MENQVTEKKERQSNFELLRILAMFLIVMSHYIVHGVRFAGVEGMDTLWLSGSALNRAVTSAFCGGGAVGVGIFFILTGFFMYDKEFILNRLLKLVLETFFYAVVLLFVALILNKTLGIDSFNGNKESLFKYVRSCLLPISDSQWWFIRTYCALFLFIPAINHILNQFDEKGCMIALAFLWIFWYTTSFWYFEYSNLQKAIYFYTVGALIKRFDFNQKKVTCIIVILVMWVIYIASDFIQNSIGAGVGVKAKLISNGFAILNVGVLIPLLAISLFCLFKNFNVKNNKFINIVASTSFGIYLLHDSTVLRRVIWNNILHVYDKQFGSNWFVLLMFASTIAVFACCSLIDYLRQIAIEKPLFKLIGKKNGK